MGVADSRGKEGLSDEELLGRRRLGVSRGSRKHRGSISRLIAGPPFSRSKTDVLIGPSGKPTAPCKSF